MKHALQMSHESNILPLMSNSTVVDSTNSYLMWLLVLESPVQSGYLPPSGSNRDRDQLVFSQKPNLTGPNRYKPVISRLASVMLQLHNRFKTGHGYNQLLTGYNRSFTYIYFITNLQPFAKRLAVAVLGNLKTNKTK